MRYFAWLKEALQKGEKWSEYDAAEVLENYRKCVRCEDAWLRLMDRSHQAEQVVHGAVVQHDLINRSECRYVRMAASPCPDRRDSDHTLCAAERRQTRCTCVIPAVGKK